MAWSVKIALGVFLVLLGACDGAEDLSEADFYRLCVERVEADRIDVRRGYFDDYDNHGILKFAAAKSSPSYSYTDSNDQKLISVVFRLVKDNDALGEMHLPIYCTFVKESSDWRLESHSEQ